MSNTLLKIRSSDNTILWVCILASVLLHASVLLIERPVTFSDLARPQPVVMTVRLEARAANPRRQEPVPADTDTSPQPLQPDTQPEENPTPIAKPADRPVTPPVRSRTVKVSDLSPVCPAAPPARSSLKRPVQPATVPKKKEPSPDTTSEDLSSKPTPKLTSKYHIIVKSRIINNIPSFPEEWDFSASVDVRIYINKDGSVKDIKFLTRSRNYFLNQAIKYAVKKSAPFPPLDPRLSISHLPVNYRFIKK